MLLLDASQTWPTRTGICEVESSRGSSAWLVCKGHAGSGLEVVRRFSSPSQWTRDSQRSLCISLHLRGISTVFLKPMIPVWNGSYVQPQGIPSSFCRYKCFLECFKFLFRSATLSEARFGTAHLIYLFLCCQCATPFIVMRRAIDPDKTSLW